MGWWNSRSHFSNSEGSYTEIVDLILELTKTISCHPQCGYPFVHVCNE